MNGKKLTGWQIFCLVVAILLAIYLVYLLCFAGEKNVRSISKACILLVSYLAVVFGVKKRQPHSGHSVPARMYQERYGDIIGDAFQNDRKSFRRLIQAIDDYNNDHFDRAHKTLTALEQVAHSRQETTAVLMFQALCYADEGLHTSAAATYETLLQYDPYNSRVWSNLGRQYDEMGKSEKAVHAYEEAIRCNPDNPYPYVNLASLYIHAGRTEEAIDAAKKALVRNAKLYQAMSALAIGYAMLGDREQSEHYHKLYALNGGDGKALKDYLDQIGVS